MAETVGENIYRPSRRAVARGAAWATPPLVMAGLAPHVAASPGQDCANATGKTVSYSFGPLVPNTKVWSGLLTGVERGFVLTDRDEISTFSQVLNVCAAPTNTCTIPAGTVVAYLNANLHTPSAALNNGFHVVRSDGAGTEISDSASSGYTVALQTPQRIAPGQCVAVGLRFVALAAFVFTGVAGDAQIRLTVSAPASGAVSGTTAINSGSRRSSVGVLG